MTSDTPPSSDTLLALKERPWLGLASYSEADSDLFHGRRDDIQRLFKCVRNSPLTVLYGSSGRGKSSLIGAGLLPALRQAGHSVTVIRREYDFLADGTFLDVVMDKMLAAHDAKMDVPPPTLWHLAHDLQGPLCVAGASEKTTPVLIFDQFEDVFTKGLDRGILAERRMKRTEEKERGDRTAKQASEAFLDQLADLVENRPPRVLQNIIEDARGSALEALLERYDFAGQRMHVVLVLREDYLARLERLRGQMPSLMRHRLELPYLSGPQALQAAFVPGTLRDPQRPILPREIAADVVRSAAGVDAETPIEEIRAVPAAILSLLCEELNEKRWAGSNQTRLQTAPKLESVTEFDARSAETILEGFYEAKMPSNTRLRSVLEDKLAPAGVREKPSIKSILHELRDVPDAETCIREQLQNDRILIVDDHDRVEFTHDKLAEIAARSAQVRRDTARIHEAAQAARKRYVQWLRWAAVMVLILAGVAAWSYNMWQRANTEKANAVDARERLIISLETMTKSVEGGLFHDQLGGGAENIQGPQMLGFWSDLLDLVNDELQREDRGDRGDRLHLIAAKSLFWKANILVPTHSDEVDDLCKDGLVHFGQLRKSLSTDVPHKLAGDLWWLRANFRQKSGDEDEVSGHYERAVRSYDKAASLAKNTQELSILASDCILNSVYFKIDKAGKDAAKIKQALTLLEIVLERKKKALDWPAIANAASKTNDKLFLNLVRFGECLATYCEYQANLGAADKALAALEDLDKLNTAFETKAQSPDGLFLQARAEGCRRMIAVLRKDGDWRKKNREACIKLAKLAESLATAAQPEYRVNSLGTMCKDACETQAIFAAEPENKDGFADLDAALHLAAQTGTAYYKLKTVLPENVDYLLKWMVSFRLSGAIQSMAFFSSNSNSAYLPTATQNLTSYVNQGADFFKSPNPNPQFNVDEHLALIACANLLNRLRCYLTNPDFNEMKRIQTIATDAIARLETLKNLTAAQKDLLAALNAETNRHKDLIGLMEAAAAKNTPMHALLAEANTPANADPATRAEILQKFKAELDAQKAILDAAVEHEKTVPVDQRLILLRAFQVDYYWWEATLYLQKGQFAEAVQSFDKNARTLLTVEQDKAKPEWFDLKHQYIEYNRSIAAQKLNPQLPAAASLTTPPK